MVDRSIVNGVINQHITGGHHPVYEIVITNIMELIKIHDGKAYQQASINGRHGVLNTAQVLFPSKG